MLRKIDVRCSIENRYFCFKVWYHVALGAVESWIEYVITNFSLNKQKSFQRHSHYLCI